MARYIDADILTEEIKSLKISLSGKDIFQDIAKESVLRIIDEHPTADVVEVVHSRWENISGFDVCNICGTSPAYWEPKLNNPKGYPLYCHNCGAKMDEEPKNDKE